MSRDVVQIIQRLTPGGIEVLALELAARLPGRNAIFSLEWTHAEIISNWPAMADVPTRIEGLSKPPGLRPDFLLPLTRKLREAAPAAVLTHHIGPLLYGGIAARLAGVPVVAHVEHDVWHYSKPRHRMIARFAAAVVRPQIVAVSHRVADGMRAIMPGARISIIPNAVDTSRFVPGSKAEARRRLGLPADRPVIGTVGRLEHVKGQDILIRALAGVPEAILVLVGGGTAEAELRALAESLGVAGRIIYLGHRSDMPVVYPAFDLVALPSRAEGLPLSMLEAQACDIPVVATDVGSVREGICPGIGMLVPSENVAALGMAVTRMLADPPAGGPRAFVLEHFSWARTLAAYGRLVMAGEA